MGEGGGGVTRRRKAPIGPPVDHPLTRDEAHAYCVGCLLGYIYRLRYAARLTPPERDFVRWLAREALARLDGHKRASEPRE